MSEGPPHVLVVDDDPNVLSRLGQLLEDEFRVTTTADWGEVNRVVFRKGCDLVLMDVNLPVLRGDQLVEALKRAENGSAAFRAPRILHSSSADEECLRQLCVRTGADGYVSKSARGAELIAQLRRHLTA
ncbi:MAG: response regulator [Planctomycetota bacterium]|nr:MAG: response regulator [Planctomycetota bacterium]